MHILWQTHIRSQAINTNIRIHFHTQKDTGNHPRVSQHRHRTHFEGIGVFFFLYPSVYPSQYLAWSSVDGLHPQICTLYFKVLHHWYTHKFLSKYVKVYLEIWTQLHSTKTNFCANLFLKLWKAMSCMLTEFDIAVQRSLLIMWMSFLNNGGLATHLFWLGTL